MAGGVTPGANPDGPPEHGTAQRNRQLVRRRLEQAVGVAQLLLHSDVPTRAAEVAEVIVAALRGGHKVIFFGNGGSASDAGHLAAELLGRFYYDRPPLPAVALADTTAALTAIGNDYSYDEVFARQLRAVAGPGDIAVALTTSGNSGNVVRAVETARELGVLTVALTGAAGGKVGQLADICLQVPSDDTPRVQEACMHLGHSICELVELRMFPPG